MDTDFIHYRRFIGCLLPVCNSQSHHTDVVEETGERKGLICKGYGRIPPKSIGSRSSATIGLNRLSLQSVLDNELRRTNDDRVE